ncbi:septum formation protein [Novosphingobium capsulatum]|uniref:Nucleoside triphosphate pyrophosphatase n=1 Tax=Novosphingobium capsulatum TaxID=13688 RepID=A0ABU1MKF0_9SPHN|nr:MULTISPECIES: nucleoside triphosphate pyrophosphatase [Novosphingobium]MBB3359218.1 septum formation protein [Novosphingobium sp. BK256]MBB3375301.1 septum formation protein [Novosphingobium sp. BK280]MBB3379991.1 septum formation protein [Novosphingobium sp. BK258]MBB3421685.1 septum formation protein [Novosphingobium sp. BK267]MBB3450000.1 septum formation protein [Novosphingobium sp. BK352]
MIVLASQSASRKAMLDAAGVPFEARSSDVDEGEIKRELIGVPGCQVAQILAEAKAMPVSAAMPGRLVLGGDSLVEVCGRSFDKPQSREQAAEHLRFFSGQTMQLHSAAVLMRDGQVTWRHCETARLKVRRLSDSFIDSYLHKEWPAVSGCVGVFRIEALGVQLFESIEGSHFTVLGMPLLALLAALRTAGELPE